MEVPLEENDANREILRSIESYLSKVQDVLSNFPRRELVALVELLLRAGSEGSTIFVFGRVQEDLYNDDGEYLDVVELSAGDTILLASGGHGLHILEDTKIVEVRQGPYLGVEKEKTFLPERLRQTGGRAEGPNSEKE